MKNQLDPPFAELTSNHCRARYLRVSREKGGRMSTNIVLTRIDNRLVHGQVGVTWTRATGTNLLVVADDAVAADPLQQQLMTVTAKSSGAGIRFFTLEKTAAIIGNAAPSQKIFLICRTPKDVRTLVEAGVELKDVNVGNMHFSEGKRPITKKVYVDDDDMADLQWLASQGINVFCQDVPTDTKHEIH